MDVTLKHIRDFYWSKRYSSGHQFDNGVWANFIPYKKGYRGVNRYGCAGQHDEIQVIKIDKDYNVTDDKIVTGGEDPRAFTFKGHPYGLTWDPHTSATTGSWIFDYKIIDLVTGVITKLNIENVPDPKVEILGKNWIPLEKDNELFFVITIDPKPSILKCDLDNGECTWVTPYTEDLDITISRGGTSLIYNESKDIYFGLGHRTHNCHYHTAFLYTLTSDFKKSTVGPDLKVSREAGVTDPLSIYQKENKFYSCMAHSPIQLGDTTEATSALYEIIL